MALLGHSFILRMPLDVLQLEENLGREFSFCKYGFGGARVRDLLGNGSLDEIVREHPDFVFIQIGGNDIVSEDRVRLREQVIEIVSDLKELILFF